MMKLAFNKKGQSTAEYAIIFGLVLATAITVQAYVKRGLQGRLKDSVANFATSSEHKGAIGLDGAEVDYSFAGWEAGQWEPGYLDSSFTIERGSDLTETTAKSEGGKVTRGLGKGTVTQREGTQRSKFDYE